MGQRLVQGPCHGPSPLCPPTAGDADQRVHAGHHSPEPRLSAAHRTQTAWGQGAAELPVAEARAVVSGEQLHLTQMKGYLSRT